VDSNDLCLGREEWRDHVNAVMDLQVLLVRQLSLLQEADRLLAYYERLRLDSFELVSLIVTVMNLKFTLYSKDGFILRQYL
jgi:hypothetical protein